MPVVSDCPGCQAAADAKYLLARLEAIAKAEGVAPYRMLDALVELLVRWSWLCFQADPPDGYTQQQLRDELVEALKDSLQDYHTEQPKHREPLH